MRHVLFITALLVPTVAFGAGFDCAKASTPVERLICADKALSELDETLSETFALELEREHDAPSLRSAQRKWIAARNSCVNALCIRQQYEQRISELSCDPRSRTAGSAMGSNQCSDFSLRVLERELSSLEERYSQKTVAASDKPQQAERSMRAEQKAWRDHRASHCATQGATEGGSAGWNKAFAGTCQVDETRRRIARLKQELGAK